MSKIIQIVVIPTVRNSAIPILGSAAPQSGTETDIYLLVSRAGMGDADLISALKAFMEQITASHISLEKIMIDISLAVWED